MKKPYIPSWVGWPSAEPPLGIDWRPGPLLRALVLTLTYAFLALALTVNYAASVPFFLLALIGLYIGLRRGFLNDLARRDKLLVLALSIYPIFVILSYLLGLHTAVGFRVLGREIRFLLTLPVFLAIFWSRPKRRHAGFALILGAVLATALSGIKWSSTTPGLLLVGIHMPQGEAATHITFGALSLLFGTLGALLISEDCDSTRAEFFLFLTGVGCGISTAFLSLSRTAWLAFPIMLFVVGRWLIKKNFKWRHLAGGLITFSITLILIFTFQPILRNRFFTAISSIKHAWTSTSYRMPKGSCPNSFNTLTRYAKIIGQPSGQTGASIAVRDAGHLSHKWGHLCTGGAAISITAGQLNHVYSFSLPRIGFWKRSQRFSMLAKGDGYLWIWWPKTHARIKTPSYKYFQTESYSTISNAKAVLKIPPGQRMELIPLQYPDFYDGYSLPLYKGSIADRFAMWRFSILLFTESPWIGQGMGSFRNLAEIYSVKGNAQSLAARRFEHPHSSYFNNLYAGGIILFGSFLFLLFSPFFIRPSLSTFTLTSFMATFCLTESMFMHSFTIMSFIILTTSLYAIPRHKGDPSVPPPLTNTD